MDQAHVFLLQCIDNYLHLGAPMPYYVKSHVEQRKRGRDSAGYLGAGWTNDEWDNFIADRVAQQKDDDLLDHGLHIIKYTVTAADLYASLGIPGQWYIGDSAGHPVLPTGVSHVMQTRAAISYLRERDAFRIRRYGDMGT